MFSSSTKVQRRLRTICQDTISKKMSIIGDEDPYELGILSTDEKLLPAITYHDIMNYLRFTSSPYTADDLKS